MIRQRPTFVRGSRNDMVGPLDCCGGYDFDRSVAADAFVTVHRTGAYCPALDQRGARP